VEDWTEVKENTFVEIVYIEMLKFKINKCSIKIYSLYLYNIDLNLQTSKMFDQNSHG